MKSITIFALLALLIVVVSANQKESRLSIVSPPELVEEIKLLNKKRNKQDDTVIECELANFGSVQYGTRIIGEVHVSNPYQACDKAEVTQNEQEFQRIPFLLIGRGKCAFADKVYNAQEAGAKIVVIVDDSDMNRGGVIMIDNGHGNNVHITSVFIAKDYGTTIKDFIEKNKNKSVTLSLELLQKKVDESVVRLWLDPTSPYSIKLIHSFNPIRQKISDNQFVTGPVFDITRRTGDNVNPKDSDCKTYKNDSVQYCAPDPDEPQGNKIPNRSNVATGGNVVEEAIRQLCIHKQSEQLWYDYYDAFSNDCYYSPYYYSDCAKISLKRIPKLDIEKYEACTKEENNFIPLLDDQHENNMEYNIFEWPAVTINDMLYRGNLEGEYIAEGICNSLTKIDDECLRILDPSLVSNKDSTESSSSSIFLTLVLVVLGFTVAFFITAYAYKRIVRREISQDVDQKVNQMVSQYIAFYESRGKNTGDQSDL